MSLSSPHPAGKALPTILSLESQRPLWLLGVPQGLKTQLCPALVSPFIETEARKE